MPEALPTSKVRLSFAKLVATPTDIAWSQAYNAGNLFLCLSLVTAESNDELSLHALGKDLFNVLQSEFFTLQEKNVNSIKTAITTSLKTVEENVTVCLTLAFFKDETLLVFVAGSGKIIMKRGEKIGVLLSKHGPYNGIVTAASGILANGDTIILETGQFAENIEQETISQALELSLPNDIVEALSPQIHKQDNGAQSAIVISCQGALSHHPFEETETEENFLPAPKSHEDVQPHHMSNEGDEELEGEEREENEKKHPKITLPKLPALPKFSPHFSFNHRRRLFLNIAIILTVLLAISIFFTVKKYNDTKQRALFQSIYPPAQQYYSEGKGLTSVNASLSQDSYKKAENLLQNGEPKFPKNSQYYQQIASLLTQVQSSLQGNTAGQATNATTIQPDPHSLLADEESMSNGLAFGEDAQNVYEITNSTITTISKTDGSTKDIIKNNNYWSEPVAIIPYDGNIYVLDQKNGLMKFVAGSGGYGKDTYFKNSAPNLSSATGMAIDGSVWLLFKDGSIMQYTSGTSNNLQVSGLLKPLNNPTKIDTDINMESVWVLDNGNNRVVQFDKNGKYQNAYSSSVISNAKDFTVDETNKKIQVLSSGKVYQISF